jgi:hypothetical protein
MDASISTTARDRWYQHRSHETTDRGEHAGWYPQRDSCRNMMLQEAEKCGRNRTGEHADDATDQDAADADLQRGATFTCVGTLARRAIDRRYRRGGGVGTNTVRAVLSAHRARAGEREKKEKCCE